LDINESLTKVNKLSLDPIILTQDLLKCPSVTPHEAGTMAIVSEFLTKLGFTVERFDSGAVSNLYARNGSASPHLCFVGHTDVVPTGELSAWTKNPYAAEIFDQKLYGRGVVDMKGAIGAYLAAIGRYLQTKPSLKGSLSILLTSDEEGPAVDGIRYVVERFKERGEKIDACLIGEPTNTTSVGDTIKIGRRGSLNATITVNGKAGHVAYPHLAKNPIPYLLNYLHSLLLIPLDTGMGYFDSSHLEVTSLDVGNPTTNVIPMQASAKFNIRFNPLHSFQSLTEYLHDKARLANLNQEGVNYTLKIGGSGDAFICEDKALQNLVLESVSKITGCVPVLSTSGGTSDGRFLKDICSVIEFGLTNTTAHQIDEHIKVDEIHRLSAVYQHIIEQFFV